MLTPQLLGTLWLDAYIVFALFGRTEARISERTCEVYAGIGNLGWSRTCQLSEIVLVSHCVTRGRGNRERHSILLQADRDILFGRMLNHERRRWLLAVLTHALAHRT